MSHAAFDSDPVYIAARDRYIREQFTKRRDEGQPTCGSADSLQPYDLGLHVFALFLILALSFGACAFPIVAKRFPKLPIPRRFLFLSRHFGTGVLLATAFVHLLPTAFTSLTDACLSPFWNEGYPAMAGFIAMVSVFVVVGIEMFFATKGAAHTHSSDYTTIVQGSPAGSSETVHHTGQRRPQRPRRDSMKRFKQGHIGPGTSADELPPPAASSSKHAHHEPTSPEPVKTTPDMEMRSMDRQESIEQPAHSRSASGSTLSRQASVSSTESEQQNTASKMSEYQQQQRALLQCLLLEAGILFHSIFIGMAVSVATGTAFVVLLIAISFHQTFEGLALGSRIAAITAFPEGSWKPWLMALAYGTTTPIGQAIGLIVHNLYDPESQTGLLMVGIMNAISSGLLLFAGLVELLAEDFLSEASYDTLKGARRLEASAAVVLGSMLMALVGAWA
ncbi:zinc-regulated transporter-like protein [Elsinoe australis]|uniref:Zinc-regulated transporter-like protein n=1 Tax=Elsinoe australis TaxID=40998 RepID=A0A4U7B624_9PEZI|nr:zinc-regulated transporter-like protein [Elsinoe australis]